MKPNNNKMDGHEFDLFECSAHAAVKILVLMSNMINLFHLKFNLES